MSEGSAELNGRYSLKSVPELADEFGFTVEQVRRRLRGLKPAGKRTSGGTYVLKDAAAYLVTPKVDLDQAIEAMKPEDLPSKLQTGVWTAQMKRLQYEKMAGELWHRDDVMSFLTAVFSRLRSSVLLWPDSLADRSGLDAEGRMEIETQCDRLLQELSEEIEELARSDSPKSVLARIFDIIEPEDDTDDLFGDEEEDALAELF